MLTDSKGSVPPKGKLYGVIYADPPWRYANPTPGREVENHYSTMSVEEICALKVPAAADCVLYLWATSPLLREAFKVIEAWGFVYKTGGIWDKEITGMGFWFRQDHEHLLIATRGKVSPPKPAERVSSVIRCRRGVHSAKPEIVRDWILTWFPAVHRLEMFSRLKRPGWDVFGNEVEHDLLST